MSEGPKSFEVLGGEELIDVRLQLNEGDRVGIRGLEGIYKVTDVDRIKGEITVRTTDRHALNDEQVFPLRRVIRNIE